MIRIKIYLLSSTKENKARTYNMPFEDSEKLSAGLSVSLGNMFHIITLFGVSMK